MEAYFLYGGMALCLFALGAIARRDWVRITSISRQVEAEVIGHRTTSDNDGTSYGAIYRFSAEGASHEVTDEVLHGTPTPPLGTRVMLSYPFGQPELAHVPRPLVWLAVYATLLFLLGMLFARTMDWLPASSGEISG
jgi:hypothetical protein